MVQQYRVRKLKIGRTEQMDDLARQARRTDRTIAVSTSRAASALLPRWDVIRQDVLRLMRTFNISTSEIEN